ncbi:hypothetical protein TNIN_164841 [Trichonephila inaurata madagascariensis]|uniref:Uncharacterized protein n=1 Tax=Trichonephila inaurata madagascariensis TaxID=2747483 RepID=A0A8X7C8I3_9ARAC|nr:hypothetical protein TNIN_164841 [Trichonephila inaurata madagascariensis]
MFFLFVSVVPDAGKPTEFEFQDTESHPSQSSRRSESTSITINSSETSLPTNLGDPTSNYSLRMEGYTTKVVNNETTSFLYFNISKVPFTAERAKHKRNTSLPTELRDLASNDVIDYKDQVTRTLTEQEISDSYQEFNNKDKSVTEKTKRSLRQKLSRYAKQKKNPNYLRRHDTFTKTNLFRRKGNKKLHKSAMDRNGIKNPRQMNSSEKFPFPPLKNLKPRKNFMHPTVAKKLYVPDKNKFKKDVTEADYLLDDPSTFSTETHKKIYDSESTLDSEEPDSEAKTKIPSKETKELENDYLNSTENSPAQIEPQHESFDEERSFDDSITDDSITWSESIDSQTSTQSARKNRKQESILMKNWENFRLKLMKKDMNHSMGGLTTMILRPERKKKPNFLLEDAKADTEAESVYLNTPDSLTEGTVSKYPDYYEKENQNLNALSSYDSIALSEAISKENFSPNTPEIESHTETDDVQKINDVSDIYDNTTDFTMDYEEETQLKIKGKDIETQTEYNSDTNLNVDSPMSNITEPYKLTDDDEIYSHEISLIKMEFQYEDTSQEPNEHNVTSVYDKSTGVEKEDIEEIYTDDTSEMSTSASEAFPVNKLVNNRPHHSYRNEIYNVKSRPKYLNATRRKTAKPYINSGTKSRGRLNKYHQKASKRKYSDKSRVTTSRSKYFKKSHQGVSVKLPTKSTNKKPHESISTLPKTHNKKPTKVIGVKDPQKYLKSTSHKTLVRKLHKNADLKKPRLYLVAVRPKVEHHKYGETNRRNYLNVFHKKNENKASRVWESSTQNKVLLVKPDHFRKKWKPTRPRERGGYYKNRHITLRQLK